MRTLAEAAYLDSRFGEETDLPRAGSALENPFVYDASARELKQLAERGLIQVTHEHMSFLDDECLIDRISFKRLR